MKRIFAIIAVSILAATAAGIDGYAAFDNNSSGAGTVTWAAQNVTSNTTVTLRSSKRGDHMTVVVNVTGTITVKSGATLTIKMSTSDTWTQRALIQVAGSFSGNCIFLVESGASLIIEGLSNSLFLGIKGSTLSSNLPAIYSDGTWTKPDISGLSGQMRWPAGYGMITTQGNVTMTHCRMYDAYSEADGAALVVRRNYTSNPINYGKVNLTDVRISNCVATFGPALVIYNQCPDAGTVFESTSTSVTPENSAVTLTDCTITNNYCTLANNTCGVIRTGGGAYSHLKLKNTTISNNYANGEGGGIVWNAHGLSNYETVCTFDGCTIINNFAATAGAGMNMSASFEFINNKTTVRGNKTNTNGGGVYIPSYTGVTGLGQQTLNMFFNEYVSVENNTAENGGGVYVDMESTALAEGSSVNLYFEEGTNISSNTATGNGGGIYYNGNSPKLYFNMYVNGGTFNSNTAVSGGGMYFLKGANMNASRTKLYFNAGDISSCTATHSGGGVYVDGLNLRCVEKVEGEVGVNIVSNTADVAGGGLYITGETSEVTVNSGSISSNTSNTNGGGVFVDYGLLKINKGVIGSNTASGNAGGIYVKNGRIEISDGSIESNTAGTYGGGIFALNASSSMSISGGTITGNTSTNHGGGIYISKCSSFDFSDGEISDNTAGSAEKSANGGGIFFAADASNLTISGGVIKNNHADNGLGGGLVVVPTVTITGGEISGNSAISGGGISLASGNLTIDGGAIKGNTASNYGAGMYMYETGTSGDPVCIFIEGEISGNMPKEGVQTMAGGGVYVNSGSFSMEGGSITGNQANHGAGIYIKTTTNTSFTEGSITENVATSHGGGIYVEGGTGISISDGVISYNEAVEGGGVYAGGGNIAISGGDIVYNEAANGGGVYLLGTSALTFSDGIIRNNKAVTSGGGYGTAYENDSNIRGAGGGIYLTGSASFTFNPDSSVGLFGNVADQVGDDLVVTSADATIVLPEVSGMTLTGYKSKTSELYWVEDYMTGDSAYSSGTNKGGQGYSPKRYRAQIADQDTVYPVPAGTYTGKYLALSIGYEIIYIILQRTGLQAGESAIYRIFRIDGDEPVVYSEVLLTGKEGVSTQSKRVAVYSGTWEVHELLWNWSYNVVPPDPIRRIITGSSSQEDKVFSFGGDKKASLPSHGEDIIINDFGAGQAK